MSIEMIAAIVAIVGSLAAMYHAWRTTPADVAAKYQAIANSAAEAAMRANTRCDNLESKIDDLEAENHALKQIIEEWQDGIEVLIQQLRESNIPPRWTPKNGKGKK